MEKQNKKDLLLEIRNYSSIKYIIKKPERPMNSFRVSLFSCFKGRSVTTKSKDIYRILFRFMHFVAKSSIRQNIV